MSEKSETRVVDLPALMGRIIDHVVREFASLITPEGDDVFASEAGLYRGIRNAAEERAEYYDNVARDAEAKNLERAAQLIAGDR
jgi:hypothetical protein